MQTKAKFYLIFTKINIDFFSGAPKLTLIPKASTSPKIKKTFLRMSVRDDKPTS